MLISNQQVNSVIKAYEVTRNQKNRTIQPTESVRRGDSLLLSPEARELHLIQKNIAQTPEVRSDLVAKLKESIDKGEYQVSSEQVAHRMLVRSLVDRIVGG
ncbi:MAG TPA: flagellar biosynthesis anti-sigma factor FlgM [Firmicutes bacterium]|uniref:Negative regulator of flagellin synthesis n=1 Tax=Capillibacterium thermochitinicola TaxID=2699427 RepID=A0A8J6I059_9FIRM|nr:flagellar biosynthesis anti-sigma factor FlgM [Capillibacterium thermochitinicola]MBA2132324.1 flagellar biosynthesis anti-sigma factor FlgM [Capillibacterium thermochitinicola]HHW12616.1 flagellar biosynthesis anti-sigma factor FlgM [Bacillota bacterium]